MSEWLIPIIIVVIVLFYIGNLSNLQKNAKMPLRKKSLNDLKETLPRNHKTEHTLDTRSKHADMHVKKSQKR